MDASDSAPNHPLSGIVTRGDVPIEDCAFCPNGHLTAPGWRKRQHYLQERIRGGFLGGFLTCTAGTARGLCGAELEWVEDYGPAMAATWALGGAEAVYVLLWPDGAPLEPR